jgi:hypothetical protein
MGWIRVESLRLPNTRPARELTSIGCFVARKLAEPILGGKANEATFCEPCALHRMGFGCQCVSQRWLEFSVTGSLLYRGRPLKGLSRVMGDYHARFFGNWLHNTPLRTLLKIQNFLFRFFWKRTFWEFRMSCFFYRF